MGRYSAFLHMGNIENLGCWVFFNRNEKQISLSTIKCIKVTRSIKSRSQTINQSCFPTIYKDVKQ